MAVTMKVSLASRDELADLHEWLRGQSGISLNAMPNSRKPNAQGVWEFLSVVFEAGGSAVAAIKAIQLWIEARVTTIDVTIGDAKFRVRTKEAAQVLPQVAAIAEKMLDQQTSERDDPAL